MHVRDLSAILPGYSLAHSNVTSRARGSAPDPGLLLLALIWGVNFPVIKGALAVVPPMAFNALRFPLAAAVLGALVLATRRLPAPRPRHLPAVVGLGLLGNVVYQLAFIHGVAATSAGNASLLLSTTPVWTVILSTGLGQERLPGSVWAGVGATVLGMALLVVGGRGVAFSGASLRGDLLIVAAAMVWAAYTVGSRPLVQRYGAMPVTAWTLWVGTPVLVILGWPALDGVDLARLGLATWLSIVYAGVLAISLAYLLWNLGIKRLGNARTAVYSNLVPVVALAAAWLALGERPTPLQLAGAAVILAGLTLTRSRGPALDGAAPRGTRRAGSPLR
jgi:drug/metabolite transporter (DMT)-like permease